MNNDDCTPAADLVAGLESDRPTILLVDDNEQNLELLTAYLEDLPCRIETAGDGVQALEKVAALNPDLVLLDIMMPRMSGFQVCERIKADPSHRDIPVIMVTALNEVADVERAVEAGTDDFLTKPVNRLELVTRVTSLLRVRAMKRELDKAVEQVRQLKDRK